MFNGNAEFFYSPAVCEHGYSLAQNLDPNSEGRGVLQFKTGLMSVIKVHASYQIVELSFRLCILHHILDCFFIMYLGACASIIISFW